VSGSAAREPDLTNAQRLVEELRRELDPRKSKSSVAIRTLRRSKRGTCVVRTSPASRGSSTTLSAATSEASRFW